MSVVEEVVRERRRQIAVEGFTPEHDDGHDSGELARAAGCYALASGIASATGKGSSTVLAAPAGVWPWDPSWWKPKDKRSDLIRAAALIVAEVERIDRATLEGRP